MLKTKRIKFDLKRKNYRWVEDYNDYMYTSVNETEIHRLIISYCRENNINLKSIKIVWGTCTVKLQGNNEDVTNLVLYITKVFCGWIEDLSY